MPDADTNTMCGKRFFRWGAPKPDRRARAKDWGSSESGRLVCQDWSDEVKAQYDAERRVREIFSAYLKPQSSGFVLRSQADRLRPEFSVLADQWRTNTRHLSLVAKKITDPAYLRIIGMGKPALPLLLEVLRDKPSHWFAALRAVANTDPAGPTANPSEARKAWLDWGKAEGYID
jgi:hypothetical protein